MWRGLAALGFSLATMFFAFYAKRYRRELSASLMMGGAFVVVSSAITIGAMGFESDNRGIVAGATLFAFVSLTFLIAMIDGTMTKELKDKVLAKVSGAKKSPPAKTAPSKKA